MHDLGQILPKDEELKAFRFLFELLVPVHSDLSTLVCLAEPCNTVISHAGDYSVIVVGKSCSCFE